MELKNIQIQTHLFYGSEEITLLRCAKWSADSWQFLEMPTDLKKWKKSNHMEP